MANAIEQSILDDVENHALLSRSPRPRDLDTIASTYPRLMHCLAWVACLSRTEAAACIRDRRDGFTSAGEAVTHYAGGKGDVNAYTLRRAFGARAIVRKLSRGY
jgi:hypothetical protein